MTRDPSLKIRDFNPDFDKLAEEVGRRIAEWGNQPTGAAYFTPDVQVTADSPSLAFMRAVRKYRGRWVMKMRKQFPRWVLASVAAWIPDGDCQGKKDHYLNRSMCVTGILFVNGRILPGHEWPDRERRPKCTPTRRRSPEPASLESTKG